MGIPSNPTEPMRNSQRLTAAQYDAIRLAALRPSRALEPMPSYIRGAARQSVLAALVASGHAVKCYLPGHVEYVLTDAGLAHFLGKDAAAITSGAGVEPVIVMSDSVVSPVSGRG